MTADKGNVTTLINNQEYSDKSLALKTTKLLTKSYVMTHLMNYNKLINGLLEQSYIEESIARAWRNNSTAFPEFCGLPNTHKEHRLHRPIIFWIDVPGYELSSFLSNVLQKLSQTFISHIKKLYLGISLKVKSLITNISLDLLLDILQTKWNNISEFTIMNSATVSL